MYSIFSFILEIISLFLMGMSIGIHTYHIWYLKMTANRMKESLIKITLKNL